MKKYTRLLGGFVTAFSRQISSFFFVCLILFSAGQASATVYKSGGKINAQDEISLNTHTVYYWPDQPNACASGTAQPTGTVSTSASQADIAKTIMGIAKTDNLGQAGALIGLMVALDESSLQIYANSTVPISETNPAWLAIPTPPPRPDGSNGTSLGVFQQQVTQTWSTYSDSISDSRAVFQLMDPAYSAEAFFGTPAGATISTVAGTQTKALQNGLQNVSGWQSMQPWVAAQAVQHSGDSSGSNYEAFEAQASSLLNQYWTGAAAVALPVPINGGSGSTATASGNSCVGTSTCTSTASASNSTEVGQSVVNCIMQEYALWTAGTMHTGESTTQKYGEYDFYKYTPCGTGSSDPCQQPESCPAAGGQCSYETWCADFASWIYLQAGYPLTGSTTNWRLPAVVDMVPADATNGQTVLNGRFVYHTVGSGYTPKPGDAAIHGYSADGRDHINFVTAVDGSTLTLIGGDQGPGTTAGHTIQLNSVSKYTLNINTPDADDPPLVGFMTPNIAAQ